jgi:hypothetical protein
MSNDTEHPRPSLTTGGVNDRGFVVTLKLRPPEDKEGDFNFDVVSGGRTIAVVTIDRVTAKVESQDELPSWMPPQLINAAFDMLGQAQGRPEQDYSEGITRIVEHPTKQ